MRALELNYPWGTENLKLVEHPDPTPERGEVVVRMRAVSLNYRDTLIAAMGGYGLQPEGSPRLIPFSDGCGVVEAVGEGVTRVAVGDRVSTLFFPNWVAGERTPENGAGVLGSQGGDGAGRDLALLPEGAVSHVPDFLTDEEVSTLPCAALTAWRALFVDAHLQPGHTVVLQGTGGVSLFGLQFAHAAGYRTIITSSSDEKLERARALGADVTVNYRTIPEWSAAVLEATDGRGADFVMEVGGAGTLDQSLKAIRIGGHIAVIGVVSDPSSPAMIDPSTLIVTSARLQGVSVGSREMYEAMCRAIAQHRIRPMIDRVMPWTDAARAIQEMGNGSHFGKIVLGFA